MKTRLKKETEYDIQAKKFAESINLTMETVYQGHFKRLGDWATANYEITLARPKKKPFTFVFSQSLNASWEYRDDRDNSFFKRHKGIPPRLKEEYWPTSGGEKRIGYYTIIPVKISPFLYDVLACLTHYDPGCFEDFCSEFGYSEDSKKVDRLYEDVKKEWRSVEALFGNVLEELREIN